jgi:hypothetical protein
VFTGNTGPLKPLARRDRMSWWPRVPGRRTAHGAGRCLALPVVGDGQGRLRRLDGEGHPDDAIGKGALVVEAGLVEHPEHAAVGGERVGDEPGDPGRTGEGGQLLQQHRAESPPLVGVVHEEGHLRLVAFARPRRQPLVAAHADDVVAEHGDQGEAVDVVDVDEALEQPRRQRGQWAEEAKVDGLGRQAAVHGLDGRTVVGTDGPDVHGPPVA